MNLSQYGQYDLGIITEIKSGHAKVVILTGEQEEVEIPLRKEIGPVLKKYMIVGVSSDHKRFLYNNS